MWRYISVALFLGSPPAGVTRYPCPMEPGLSSQMGLSPRPRGCPAYLPEYITGKERGCQIILLKRRKDDASLLNLDMP